MAVTTAPRPASGAGGPEAERRTPKGSSLEHSRIFNRRLIFELLHRHGPLSRIDIALRVGLTPQTVSSITRELLDQSLIEEAGRSVGQRGQPQIYLRPNPLAGFSAGVHLDRGRVAAILCDLKLQVVGRAEWTGDTSDPGETLAAVAGLLGTLIETTGTRSGSVWGIGLVLPTRNDDVYETAMPLPGWDAWRNVDVAGQLRALCGLPVLVENDATAAAIGERFGRAAAGARDFVGLYLGYGVGAGVIVDGMPVKGRWGNAGELAFLPVPTKLPRRDGRLAVIDEVLSLTGIANAIGCEPHRIDLERLAGLHRRRDGDLMAWMEEAADGLRFLVAIIETLLDPEFITLGGAVPPTILSALVERAYPLQPSLSARRDRDHPRLVTSELGPGAAVFGAASLPVFANINPNFRHLYIQQLSSLDRPFDRLE